jgi:hypothetical protein
VVNETKLRPPVPFHDLLPSPKPTVDPDIDLPNILADKVEAIKNPMRKKVNGSPTVDNKGKKNAWLILRMARNKPKPSAEQKPIVLNESLDSDIECFLVSEYPYSQGLCPEPPFDFISNLPPCLRNNPSYPGIKLPNETLGDSPKPSTIGQSSCNQCNVWLE